MNSAQKVMILATVCLLAGCCCEYKIGRYNRLANRLESYVIVGVGERPECVVPVRRYERFTNKGDEVKVWLRAVYYDNIQSPIVGKIVRLEVVDVFGNDTTPYSELNTYIVKTTSEGFNAEEIVFRSTRIGTYIIKAIYGDKRSTAFSYGPTIVIMKENNIDIDPDVQASKDAIEAGLQDAENVGDLEEAANWSYLLNTVDWTQISATDADIMVQAANNGDWEEAKIIADRNKEE